jgi:hypothetical protein
VAMYAEGHVAEFLRDSISTFYDCKFHLFFL